METLRKKMELEELGSQSVWPVLAALLESGHYQQVVELLHEVQSCSRRAGEGVLADILATALEICLVMRRCQAQVEWHRQAAMEARWQEQQLGQRFETMLALAHELGLSELRLPANIMTRPSVAALASNGTSQANGVDGKQATQVTHVLAVTCLRPFSVALDDQPVTNWNGLKARSIFKCLVVYHGTPIAKDKLMDIFWPEAEPEAARRNLHQAIFNLRQGFKPVCDELQIVRFEHDAYSLNPELLLRLDYAEFEDHVRAGQRLEATEQFAEAMAEYELAADLYHEDFLEEDRYEDWTMLQREYLRSIYLDLANRLSEYYVQQERYRAAMALCQKILSYDNCHEPTHRRLMRCLLAQNHRRLAVQQYQTCVKVLQDELSVAPAAETEALYEKIVQGRRPDFSLAELETLAS
ncbi:MAG TPA: BTAD domain-containing putative transcriptional regulator [Anaerolineae bacterium]